MDIKDLPFQGQYQKNGRVHSIYYIYKLLNLDNGKVYIGKTLHPKWRAEAHLGGLRRHKHPNRLLNADCDCNFEFSIIEETYSSWEAHWKEKRYMQIYQSFDERYGYNANDWIVQAFRKEVGLPYKEPYKRPKKTASN